MWYPPELGELIFTRPARFSDDERNHLANLPNVGIGPYLQWLTERADPRADVLQRELAWRAGPSGPRSEALRDAIATLDPAWWAVVTHERMLNCGRAAQQPPRVRFRVECDRKWSELDPTGEPGRRDCSTCNRSVYWCPTVEAVAERAVQGACVAVPAALVIEGADQGPSCMIGHPDYLAMWSKRIFGVRARIRRRLTRNG